MEHAGEPSCLKQNKKKDQGLPGEFQWLKPPSSEGDAGSRSHG